jgi:hypothetical protein
MNLINCNAQKIPWKYTVRAGVPVCCSDRTDSCFMTTQQGACDSLVQVTNFFSDDYTALWQLTLQFLPL